MLWPGGSVAAAVLDGEGASGAWRYDCVAQHAGDGSHGGPQVQLHAGVDARALAVFIEKHVHAKPAVVVWRHHLVDGVGESVDHSVEGGVEGGDFFL